MKYYKMYMERQEISREAHETLLALGREGAEQRRKTRSLRRWGMLAGLAACCALIVGLADPLEARWQALVASYKPGALMEFHETDGSQGTFLPDTSGGGGLVVEGAEGDKLMFPMVPYINYQDTASGAESSASIAMPAGGFDVELAHEDILKLFFGPQGEPGPDHPTTPKYPMEEGDLPWMLFWGGYALRGSVTYDGSGQMFWLRLYGEHPDGPSFELELAPGRLPPSCLVEPGLETTEVNGVAVTGWSRAYDRNGDDETDYICGSEFMAGDVGVRFENVGSPFQAEYGDSADMLMGGAAQFNALFVRQALSGDGGLYVDHLLQTEDIPAWRDAAFATLAQARAEESFAPYLPGEDIPGYGEFHSSLSYQEDRQDRLFVRWSRGYDDVEVCVYLPEGEPWWGETVDVSVPASYDTRLYTIPWVSSVPDEYWANFYRPTFRAEDMSLSVVEARGTEKDTGGMSYIFSVLHESGALVEYTCDGLTAQQVWDLVEPTLEKS